MVDCYLNQGGYMDLNYEIINRTLKTDDFTTNFEYNIQDVIFWDEIYIVLLSIPNEVNEIDNIYGVNLMGKIIWKIENPIKAFKLNKDEQGYNYLAACIYVHMNMSAEGVFTANTFSGMKYICDYKTGKLLKQGLSRW